jgi:hypothetical protein
VYNTGKTTRYKVTGLPLSLVQEGARAVAAKEVGVGEELPSLSADELQKLQTAFKYSPCFQHFSILNDFTF